MINQLHVGDFKAMMSIRDNLALRSTMLFPPRSVSTPAYSTVSASFHFSCTVGSLREGAC